MTCSRAFVAIFKAMVLSFVIRIESPCIDYPVLPALPTICLYYIELINSLLFPAYFVEVIITLAAGRLTPAASVEVQNKTLSKFNL